MIPHYQVPRNTLLWLFATQLLVVAPHFFRTPWWVMVVLSICMLWRLQVFRGQWNFPAKTIKFSLLFASIIGLLISFPSFFGLEALVSTLLVAYGLKLLEMYHKRDALVVLYLSFFLVMTALLFEQGMALAVYSLLVMTVILTALTGLYQEQGHVLPRENFWRAGIMVLQAIPLMVLMFVVLPRIPSFWSIPLQKSGAKTGMSDSMSPGDFGRLTRSNELVMRVTFEGVSPDPRDLYWRGLVFSRFDGRRWETDETLWGKPAEVAAGIRYDGNQKEFLQKLSDSGLATIHDTSGNDSSYEVILEASQTPWLYALESSLPNTRDVWFTHEQLLVNHGPVMQRFKYDLLRYPSLEPSQMLSAWQRKRNLALPPDSNPVATETARRWRQESASDEQYVQRLMSWFHDKFYYTLQPPPLGKNSVDEFLFQTQQGFCEHFASSFVFMLRAAGIPARVVAGYQGGEWNPVEQYYLVRQYDAHAWAEAWIGGEQGHWVRFDPTFAVAPHRILDGFRETFARRGELELPLLSLENYRNISLINKLRLQWDTLNYQWARWVLGYDQELQSRLLTRLLGEYSVTRLLLFAGAFFLLLLAVLYAALWWQERDKTPDPVLRAYRHFCRRMARRGMGPVAGETPEVFLLRLARVAPERYATLKPLGERLYAYWYGNAASDPAGEARELCKMLRGS